MASFSLKKFREENPNADKKLRAKLGIGGIKKNAVRCNFCKTEVESLNRHDFVYCSCGKIAVDGGSWYCKRIYHKDPEKDYKELTEYWE